VELLPPRAFHKIQETVCMNQETLVGQCEHFNTHVSKLLNAPQTSLQEKVQGVAHYYIDMIIENPEVATFMLSTARSTADNVPSKMKEVLAVNDSVMALQIGEEARINGKNIHPQHFIMNLVSLCVFPLLAGDMIKKYGKLAKGSYDAMMEERKALIPVWVMGMITG